MGRLVEGGAIADHITGSASSPATTHYAGHVGAGMLVVITISDPFGGAWTPTSVTDSAGNVYALIGGAAGAPYSIPADHNFVEHTNFYLCQYPGIWAFHCELAHAVTAATAVTVHVSADADFFINGNQFASIDPTSVAVTAVTSNYSPDASRFPPGSTVEQSIFNIPIEVRSVSPAPGPTGVALASMVVTKAQEVWTPPRFDQYGGVLVETSRASTVLEPGTTDTWVTTADVRLDYRAADVVVGADATGDINPASSDPVYAVRLGRGFSWAYDGEDSGPLAPVLDSAFTLTGHTVAADDTLVGGKRLDMVFESHGSWNAGPGFAGSCLSGDTMQEVSSWWDYNPGVANLALAATSVNTPSGPQPWSAILQWWRSLITDPAVAEGAVGGAGLMDLALYLDTTQTASLHKACGGSVATGLSQRFQVWNSNVVPDTNGQIGSGAEIMTGDLLVDGAVTATGVSLDTTVIGHELGFRMWHHHVLPWFMPQFVIVDDASSAWNTMTAHVTARVSMYFSPAYTDPAGPPDTWPQPGDGPGEGPPLPGDTPSGPTVVSSLTFGEDQAGVVKR